MSWTASNTDFFTPAAETASSVPSDLRSLIHQELRLIASMNLRPTASAETH